MPDDIKIIDPNLEDQEENIQPTIADKPKIFSKFDTNEEEEAKRKEREAFIKHLVLKTQ